MNMKQGIFNLIHLEKLNRFVLKIGSTIFSNFIFYTAPYVDWNSSHLSLDVFFSFGAAEDSRGIVLPRVTCQKKISGATFC